MQQGDIWQRAGCHNIGNWTGQIWPLPSYMETTQAFITAHDPFASHKTLIARMLHHRVQMAGRRVHEEAKPPLVRALGVCLGKAHGRWRERRCARRPGHSGRSAAVLARSRFRSAPAAAPPWTCHSRPHQRLHGSVKIAALQLTVCDRRQPIL